MLKLALDLIFIMWDMERDFMFLVWEYLPGVPFQTVEFWVKNDPPLKRGVKVELLKEEIQRAGDVPFGL